MVSFEISQRSWLLPLFVYAAAVICKFPLLKIPDQLSAFPCFFSTVLCGILLLMKPNGNTTVAVELYLWSEYASMTLMFSDLFPQKSC